MNLKHRPALSLSDWQPAGEAETREEKDGSLILNDTVREGWHFLRLSDPEFVSRAILITISARPLLTCDTDLYIHHHGFGDVAHISRYGQANNRAGFDTPSVEAEEDGWLLIKVKYMSLSRHLSIGTFNRSGMYKGSGRDQYQFRRIEVEARGRWQDTTPEALTTYHAAHQSGDGSGVARLDGTLVSTRTHGRLVTFFVNNPADHIQQHHFRGNFYEQEELNLISAHIKPRATFVDIGANVGNHAIYAAKILDAGLAISL